MQFDERWLGDLVWMASAVIFVFMIKSMFLP
jgi:hypothetical protein